MLPFIKKNIYREVVLNKFAAISKDTVYNFLKSPHSNWRMFIIKLAVRLFTFFDALTSDRKDKVLIIDDSPFIKDRPSKLKLMARCHYHSKNSFYKGFKLLTMGWPDGCSFVPAFFSLLSSANVKNRYNGILQNLDSRTNVYKRRMESLMHAPDIALIFIKDALRYGLQAKAVVFDSWFGTKNL